MLLLPARHRPAAAHQNAAQREPPSPAVAPRLAQPSPALFRPANQPRPAWRPGTHMTSQASLRKEGGVTERERGIRSWDLDSDLQKGMRGGGAEGGEREMERGGWRRVETLEEMKIRRRRVQAIRFRCHRLPPSLSAAPSSSCAESRRCQSRP